MAPLGLRDRDAGTVTLSTSLGLWKKLDRIRRNPGVAVAYHAREHGLTDRPGFVLVQGRASFDPEPDREWLESITPEWDRFLGPRLEGPRGRHAQHLLLGAGRDHRSRSSGSLAGPTPERPARRRSSGTARPAGPPPQKPPKGGTAPREDTAKVAAHVERLPHTLLGWCGTDGMPEVVPVTARQGGRRRRRARGPGRNRAGGRPPRRAHLALVQAADGRPGAAHPHRLGRGKRRAASSTRRTPRRATGCPRRRRLTTLGSASLATADASLARRPASRASHRRRPHVHRDRDSSPASRPRRGLRRPYETRRRGHGRGGRSRGLRLLPGRGNRLASRRLPLDVTRGVRSRAAADRVVRAIGARTSGRSPTTSSRSSPRSDRDSQAVSALRAAARTSRRPRRSAPPSPLPPGSSGGGRASRSA